jgi:uncharacterized protein (DUF952 family)
MSQLIFKIESADVWQSAQAVGVYTGAPVDVADGFIHFSAGDQVAGTLGKHFAGRKALLLIAVDAARLGSDLHWEVSRAGALFPHLYAHLAIDAVADTRPIPDDHDLSGFADWGIEPEW